MTLGHDGNQHGNTRSPLRHPASKIQGQNMEERHKNKAIQEEHTIIIGSEKLNPLKYQNKDYGFHLQMNKLILRGLSLVISPTFPNGTKSYFFFPSGTPLPNTNLAVPCGTNLQE